MEKREFKYKEYLQKYKNCPRNCTEKDLTAYRWVHNPVQEGDFKPILLTQPHRALKNNDSLNCTGFAQSLYKDLRSSVDAYLNTYNFKMDRQSKREHFKNRVGNHSLKIQITKEDGVCEEPKEDGHFHFFEYEYCNFLTQNNNIIDNFAYNGTDN